MKASKVASVVAALIASDAKPTEAQILAAIIAADKKGKDEGGLGPVEIENKKKAGDEFPPKDKEKAEDEDKDDEKAKDADMDDMDAEDEDKDDEKAKDEADVQPKKSASGNSGAGGAEPAKDKKGMDAAIKAAIDARDALHAARRDVEPVLGVVAYDSAAAVYKAALVKLGVAVDGVDASAYPVLFKLARDKADAQAPTMASDAAVVKTMSTVIKGYDRLR